VAWLPAGARRSQAAVEAVLESMFKDADRESDARVLRGIGVSRGMYRGRARVIQSPMQIDQLSRGDVLITRSTSPAWNVVLPLLGALVTDRGGALSHAAIVSREFGIPGVVGTKTATAAIPDGAQVQVDGDNGEVTVLR
jgi:pyruvate,water dikinase